MKCFSILCCICLPVFCLVFLVMCSQVGISIKLHPFTMLHASGSHQNIRFICRSLHDFSIVSTFDPTYLEFFLISQMSSIFCSNVGKIKSKAWQTNLWHCKNPERCGVFVSHSASTYKTWGNFLPELLCEMKFHFVQGICVLEMMSYGKNHLILSEDLTFS